MGIKDLSFPWLGILTIMLMLVVDFHRCRPTTQTPVNIWGTDSGIVDWCSLQEGSELTLPAQEAFGVQQVLLKTFSDSVVASAIFYGICWNSSLSAAERKWLDKLIRKASSVMPIDSVLVVGDRRLAIKSSMSALHAWICWRPGELLHWQTWTL